MRFENLIYAWQYKSTAAEQIYIARIYESLLQTVHTNANSTAAFSRRGFKLKLDPNQCNYCLLYTQHLAKGTVLCLAAGTEYLGYFYSIFPFED